MRKNVASQKIQAQLISSTDGSDVTSGTTTVFTSIDGAAQDAGVAATHLGNGAWLYAPAQALTNGDHVSFTFTNSSAISVTVNVYPVSFDYTDSVRIGLTSLPNATVDGAGGLATSAGGATGIDDLATPTNITAGTITTTTNLTNLPTIPADWLTAAGTAADFTTEIQVGLATAASITALNDIAAADVWAVDATAQQTAGTFGQAIGDPAANAKTLYQALIEDAAGASVTADVAAVKVDTAAVLVDTADIQPKIGSPAADLSADIAAVKVDTAAVLVDTADMQPKLGSPAADVSADIAAVKVDTAATLVDTGTTLPALLPAALVGGRMDANMGAISADATAADNLEASTETIVTGAAEAGTLSTTQMSSDLTEATDDHYIGRTVIWRTGVLAGQASDVTDYTGVAGVLTFTAVTEAPSAGDTFILV